VSTTSKRRRRKTNPGPSALTEGGAAATAAARRFPEWHWRTFPVFCALAGGLFGGMYLGIIAAAVGGVFSIAVFIVIAVLMGLALSRLSTRWLLERNWIKPRTRRPRT
jgi:predicted lipid-binding transport protein (Tim44 family)